jgi:hypothetical protein
MKRADYCTKYQVVILSLLVVLVTSCTNPKELKKGLVAYYSFSGNALDESGNNNNGKITGALFVADKFGDPGKDLSFDGIDDFVEIPNSPTINITGSLSISCWICPHTAEMWESWVCKVNTNGSKAQYRFGFGDTAPASFGLTIFNSGWYDYWINENVIHLKTWSHVLMIADQEKHVVNYYVNGKLAGTIKGIKNFAASEDPLFIGHQRDDYNFFDGLIDEVRIYNRVLNRREVRTLYKNFKTQD